VELLESVGGDCLGLVVPRWTYSYTRLHILVLTLFDLFGDI
jgi:hypothetical protein